MTGPLVKPSWGAIFKDAGERGWATFLQQFSLLVLPIAAALVQSNSGVTNDSLWLALGVLDSAAFAGILSFVSGLALAKLNWSLSAKADLIVRLIRTYIFSVAGTMGAASITSVIHFNWIGALAMAVPVTAVAWLKGKVAQNRSKLQEQQQVVDGTSTVMSFESLPGTVANSMVRNSKLTGARYL